MYVLYIGVYINRLVRGYVDFIDSDFCGQYRSIYGFIVYLYNVVKYRYIYR